MIQFHAPGNVSNNIVHARIDFNCVNMIYVLFIRVR